MKLYSIAVGSLLSLSAVMCTTNPLTGRKSFQIGSLNSEIMASSFQQYNQTLKQSKVISGTAAAQQVQRVGTRIKDAAQQYYRSIGRGDDLSGYAWEFHLLDDKQVNAWCMPGGKVAVYTGILPITKDDDGMAVVLGHEISHALAGHGNERISQAMIAEYGGAILGSSISGSQWANVFKQLYPVGSQVVLLKYGRTQELEADKMGLYFMAMAKYNPEQAIPFWKRMDAKSGGSNVPEFLSTHPNPGNRIADIQRDMPKALEYYKAAGGKL